METACEGERAEVVFISSIASALCGDVVVGIYKVRRDLEVTSCVTVGGFVRTHI